MRGHDKAPAAVAGLALVGAAAYWLPATSIVSGAARRMFGVSATIEAGEGVALTFDDGPHPSGTPAVLETLAGAGVPATFFLVGEQVERRPALAAEIVAAGHEIANHLMRDERSALLPDAQFRRDLARVRPVADLVGEVVADAIDLLALGAQRARQRVERAQGVLDGGADVHHGPGGEANVVGWVEGIDGLDQALDTVADQVVVIDDGRGVRVPRH
jgi:hypothetical protein